MKFLLWCVGVMVILLGLDLRGASPGGWTAVWLTIAVLWFFAGVGAAGIALAKLVSGKVGAGALRGFRGPSPAEPAPHKEE